MTGNEIDAFLAVVRWGSITQAAQALYISQPALSRRIQLLEQELGYPLFKRQKGIRNAALTAEGQAFLPLAEKWKLLLRETANLNANGRRKLLKLSSVESVSSYIFPEVFRAFLSEGADRNLIFHNYHSAEAYGYVESGLVDLAFVSDRRYAQNVDAFPAFTERYLLVFGKQFCVNGTIPFSALDPTKEIRLPWTDDFDRWHKEHFDESVFPHVFLDQMNLMEEFLQENTWTFVPESVARKLAGKGFVTAECESAPPPRVIYYLVKSDRDQVPAELIESFLTLLKSALCRLGATPLL